MEKALFSIQNYRFDKIYIDLENRTSDELDLDFDIKGLYDKTNSIFDLTFTIKAFTKNTVENPFIQVRCVATFLFENVTSFEQIPDFFYRNSIAILFPYIRAYVSIITMQANIAPLILPTLNLTSLEKPLRENTTQK